MKVFLVVFALGALATFSFSNAIPQDLLVLSNQAKEEVEPKPQSSPPEPLPNNQNHDASDQTQSALSRQYDDEYFRYNFFQELLDLLRPVPVVAGK